MTREPKDYEIWYVKLPDGSIKPAVAFIPTSAENTVWYIDGDTCCADPIAHVPSYELVAELVAALSFMSEIDKHLTENLDRLNKSHYGVNHPSRWNENDVFHSPDIPMKTIRKAAAVLAKARAAGLEVTHD